MGHERPPQSQHLLLAPAKASRSLANTLLKARKQAIHEIKILQNFVLLLLPPAQESPKLQIFEDAEGAENSPSLRDKAYPGLQNPSWTYICDGGAIEDGGSPGCRKEPHDGPEQGGLTCPIRSQYCHHFTSPHVQADSAQSLDVPIGRLQILNL